MTKAELIEILKKCNAGDQEDNHLDADKALLDYINDSEVANAYNAVEKWYA